jgi:hypothetical protein
MARDILCIPATSVGVERVFNTARDFSGYQRGRITSDTLRAEILIKFDQHHDTQTEYNLEELSKTIDIADMSKEEIAFEIEQRTLEIEQVNNQTFRWDSRQYLPEGQPEPNTLHHPTEWNRNRSRRIRDYRRRAREALRTEQSRQSRARLVEPIQELSISQRRAAQRTQERIHVNIERNRQNPTLYDITNDEVPEHLVNEHLLEPQGDGDEDENSTSQVTPSRKRKAQNSSDQGLCKRRL